MADIPLIRRPDGTFAEVQADESGAIKVAADLGVDTVTSPPPEGTPAIPVAQVGPVDVVIIGAQALSAPLDLAGSGVPVRTVSEGDISAIASNTSATNARLGTIGGYVDDVETNQQLEIQATQDVGTAVAAVETELQDKATETTLQVIANLGMVSASNSTTTPLAANGTFTGSWIDALQYVDVRVAVTADVDSADPGLFIEQSHDGSAVIADDSYMVAAGRKGTFSAQRAARYVRVRYLNGAAPQATFALQTILSRHAGIQSVHNIGHVDEIHGEDDGQLVIAVLAGSSPGSEAWKAARVDQYRRLMVATAQESSPLHTVSTGRAAVGTTSETLIVSPPYTEQTTGAQRSLVSTSAQDGVGGTGIRSVTIEYYKADLTGPFFETVTLNGTTPVNTVATDICYIEKLYGVTGGNSLALAAGDISLKASTGGGGATVWQIPTGDRRARGAHHYLAPGSDVHVTSTIAGVNGAGSASLYLLFGEILTPNYCFRQVSPTMRVTNDGQSQLLYPSPLNVEGPGKLIMAVIRDSASSTLTYFGGFSFYHNTDV